MYCAMDPNEFRYEAHKIVDWMADYLENIQQYPVKSQVSPGYLNSLVPGLPPAEGESMKSIFTDFKNIILPGITH